MTANINIAGAAPTQLKWTGLKWPEHEVVVKKLQVRIAKAIQEKRYGKVKALQHLLTTSFSAKVTAIRKVTQNKGKNTPGVDGITLRTPSEKAAMVKQLKRRNYKPEPLRRIYILKKDGKKKRPLSIPSLRDRCMQQLHYQALSPVSESTLGGHSYGFRPERSCADAIEQTFIALGQQDAAQWIMEGDIRGCFDNINHEWMLNNICMDKIILKKWLKAGYIETNKLFPTHTGTPQGGIISPAICNLVLNGMEDLLDKNFGKRRSGINIILYADDFIITAKTKETLEERIKPLVVEFLKKRGLELSEEKTKITHINNGFDFLGKNVRKYPAGKDRSKLLIKPSKDNVKTFLKKVRDVIHNSGSMTQGALIGQLNPMIRGWVNYHRSGVSKMTFNKVDHEIWSVLWRWAKRRHPKKGKRWIMKKYFVQQGLRHYCFSVRIKHSNGHIGNFNLIRASDKPIVRHIKVRSNANIFNPEHEEYFEARKSAKLMNSVTGTKTVVSLLRRQANKCACCEGYISMTSKWIVHLLISKLKGGDYKNSNLCIIHKKCHREGFENGFVYKLSVVSNRSD